MAHVSRSSRETTAASRTALVLSVATLLVGVGARPAAQPQHQDGADHQSRHMDHRFTDPERYAQSFDDPGRDEWQQPERVIQALALEPGSRVADIGAGTGYFTVRLARTAGVETVFAVDIEPAMVDYLRERATEEGLDTVRPVLADADGTNLPEPVDAVLIVNTYHHIPDRLAYFTALRALMAPGARLAIVDYRPGAPGGGPPDSFRFSEEEIDAELAAAGFERRARHDFLSRQHFLVYGAVSAPSRGAGR